MEATTKNILHGLLAGKLATEDTERTEQDRKEHGKKMKSKLVSHQP
jgi:hypothetical protein